MSSRRPGHAPLTLSEDSLDTRLWRGLQLEPRRESRVDPTDRTGPVEVPYEHVLRMSRALGMRLTGVVEIGANQDTRTARRLARADRSVVRNAEAAAPRGRGQRRARAGEAGDPADEPDPQRRRLPRDEDEDEVERVAQDDVQGDEDVQELLGGVHRAIAPLDGLSGVSDDDLLASIGQGGLDALRKVVGVLAPIVGTSTDQAHSTQTVITQRQPELLTTETGDGLERTNATRKLFVDAVRAHLASRDGNIGDKLKDAACAYDALVALESPVLSTINALANASDDVLVGSTVDGYNDESLKRGIREGVQRMRDLNNAVTDANQQIDPNYGATRRCEAADSIIIRSRVEVARGIFEESWDAIRTLRDLVSAGGLKSDRGIVRSGQPRPGAVGVGAKFVNNVTARRWGADPDKDLVADPARNDLYIDVLTRDALASQFEVMCAMMARDGDSELKTALKKKTTTPGSARSAGAPLTEVVAALMREDEMPSVDKGPTQELTRAFCSELVRAFNAQYEEAIGGRLRDESASVALFEFNATAEKTDAPVGDVGAQAEYIAYLVKYVKVLVRASACTTPGFGGFSSSGLALLCMHRMLNGRKWQVPKEDQPGFFTAHPQVVALVKSNAVIAETGDGGSRTWLAQLNDPSVDARVFAALWGFGKDTTAWLWDVTKKNPGNAFKLLVFERTVVLATEYVFGWNVSIVSFLVRNVLLFVPRTLWVEILGPLGRTLWAVYSSTLVYGLDVSAYYLGGVASGWLTAALAFIWVTGYHTGLYVIFRRIFGGRVQYYLGRRLPPVPRFLRGPDPDRAPAQMDNV